MQRGAQFFRGVLANIAPLQSKETPGLRPFRISQPPPQFGICWLCVLLYEPGRGESRLVERELLVSTCIWASLAFCPHAAMGRLNRHYKVSDECFQARGGSHGKAPVVHEYRNGWLGHFSDEVVSKR